MFEKTNIAAEQIRIVFLDMSAGFNSYWQLYGRYGIYANKWKGLCTNRRHKLNDTRLKLMQIHGKVQVLLQGWKYGARLLEEVSIFSNVATKQARQPNNYQMNLPSSHREMEIGTAT